MYYFIEGQFPKGPNSVTSFLHDIFKKVINNNVKKIILMSDSCGGQNKNYIVMKFLILISMLFKVKIMHLFPVRGHSYCICDRNFAYFSKLIKTFEQIESPEEYINLLKLCKFETIKGISYDYKSCFTKKFKGISKLYISNAFKIEYEIDGTIKFYKNYFDNTPYTNKKLTNSNNISCFNDLQLEKVHYISKEKSDSVKNLIDSLKPQNQTFIKSYLNEYTKK
jgi:hypothetical protein